MNSKKIKSFILALCQLKTSTNKEKNLIRASELITSAVKLHKAQICVLPEFFNSPYDMSQVPQYAEEETSSTSLNHLKSLAKELDIYLIGGSMPEKDGPNYYNTCYCINRKGEVITKHRKVHLFDVDIPGKITFKESSILKSGNNYSVFETEFCKFGIGICFDIRFPEYAQILKEKYSVDFLVYPGAFNTVTGPMHWELCQRSRANDNHVYVAMCSPARNYEDEKSYQAWGYSMIVDPFGKVVSALGYEEGILQSKIDLSLNEDVDNQIPILNAKRNDMYQIIDKTKDKTKDENFK